MRELFDVIEQKKQVTNVIALYIGQEAVVTAWSLKPLSNRWLNWAIEIYV